MTHKGRHTSESSGTFYRDLLIMTVGIVLVGAAVFLLLYLLAGGPDPEASPTSTVASTTSTSATDSTVPATTTPSETTTTAGAPTTSATVPLRPPEEVRVVVLNSLTLSGAAGRFSQELADAGYQTLPPDDYDPELDPSRIWYRDGFSAEANVLLEFLPGALVEPLPDPELVPGSDVVVVLGVGYEE